MPSGPVPQFKGLPSGRGLRADPNLIDQRESFDRRQKEATDIRGWFASVSDPFHEYSALTLSPTVWRLAPLREIPDSIELSKATVRVSTLEAAQFVRAAICSYETQPTRIFRTLPNSVVNFPTGTAGVVEVDLVGKVLLHPKQRYFLLSGTTSNVALAVRAVDDVSMPLFIRTASKAAAATIPPQIAFAATSLTQAGIPMVIYLSSEAAEIW